MTERILSTVEGGLGRITLNRPDRMNAFDDRMAPAWAEVTVEATTRDDVRAILLEAEGRNFCAGGDVMSMAAGATGSDITQLAGVINSGIRALAESSVPVAVAAQGPTAGGGLGILLTGDYAVIGENSRIGSLYANIGLTPDLSVSAQLAKAVGERRALQLVLRDRMLGAQEALDWGLVAEVVGPDDVRSRAEEVARFWLAYGQAKRLVRDSSARSFADQLAEEARSIGASLDTPDAQARVAAFAAASAQKQDRRNA